jgi:hypothetical protein
MEQITIISGNTEDELWQKVTEGLNNDELLEYEVTLDLAGKKVLLDIDIDPGGGFESGYEFTRLTAGLANNNDFNFAIHHEGFIDTMGKFFGMEDIEIGYPEFDKKLIVKTNDAERVKTIFSDDDVRDTFQSLTEFTLHIANKDIEGEKEAFLELEIQKGVTDPNELRKIYHSFFSLFTALERNTVIA